jgi:hypothetical protein
VSNHAVIQGGAASPFRIVIAGASPTNPGFEDVIFDGNQMPLRISQTGEVSVPSKGLPAFIPPWSMAFSTPVALLLPTASGQRRFCNAFWKRSVDPRWRTPFYSWTEASTPTPSGGGGIAMANTEFAGVNFFANVQNVTTGDITTSPITVAYVVYNHAVG